MTRYFRGLTQPYLGEIEGQLGIEIQLKVRSKLFVKYIRILFALANIICIRRANILPTPITMEWAKQNVLTVFGFQSHSQESQVSW